MRGSPIGCSTPLVVSSSRSRCTFGICRLLGGSVATQRSYGMDLLRWFRFLWALEVPWNQVTRSEACDFSRWIQITDKPRDPGFGAATLNPVTGKRSPGSKYAASTRGHSESVLRSFYEFHAETGSGPMVNPFPLVRRGRRAHAHHNPMELYRHERAGLYRPRPVRRVPRGIPDEKFNELFAQLGLHRDRALVAFWVSSGARACELLGARYRDSDPGQQLITVVRKGSRAIQPVPASPDAFVWLRLYQAQMQGLVAAGGDESLWWTLRRPFRPLGYHAAYRMFTRANAALGSNWTLHDLRHTAAYRMARDSDMPLTDVQWVLGHAQLSTSRVGHTARYLCSGPFPCGPPPNQLCRTRHNGFYVEHRIMPNEPRKLVVCPGQQSGRG